MRNREGVTAMGYCLYSEDGYVQDVASIGGWSDFCDFVSAHGGDRLRESLKLHELDGFKGQRPA